MDWIKVKTKHILFEYTDLSDSEFRAWIKLMALASNLEHDPTHPQMLKEVHYKTLISLQEKLNTRSTTLQDIFNKVLIDVQDVLNRREDWKIKKQRKRDSIRNVQGDVQGDVSPKRREDIEKRREEKNNITTHVADKSAACPHEEIVSLYHKTLPELPAVQIWTPKRRSVLQSRWREQKERQCLKWWEEYFLKIKHSAFLTGNVTDFKANLEWVINQSNMVKILEGKYDGGGNGNVGIRTARSDPRDKTLQSREDAECARITAEWEAAKASSGSNT